MGRQLDVVALEPFYGGVRKQTLDLLARCSRHRWTIFKLPARRIERRLSTAAQWFSQQITRTPGFKCDVVFASDAMNLAEMLRLNPALGHKPSVAYFYGNQLAGDAGADSQARMALLGTASSATELWFNSMFHMREFLSNAAAIFDGHRELGGKQPLKGLVAKSQLLHPPVEIVPPTNKTIDAERKGRTICLDNRPGAETAMFTQLLRGVVERKEATAVFILGDPVPDIPEGLPTVQVDVKNEAEVLRTLRRCEIYIQASQCEDFDPLALRAMALGCIPLLRKEGFFIEFLPPELHTWCVYDGTSPELLQRLMDLWYLRRPSVKRKDLDTVFGRYTPVLATRLIDQRLEHLFDQVAA